MGRGWGSSKKTSLEGGNLAFSFWLRISVQKAEGRQGHPGCGSWELLSVAGTIGFGEELDRLECTGGEGGPWRPLKP